MNPKKIDSRISISPQLSIDDVRAAHALGFRSIIVNRPDGEEAGQPTIAEIQQAASEAGLGFTAIPVRPGTFTDDAIARFAEALRTLDGPVIAYCRSGIRAASLWALSQSPALGAEAVQKAASSIGYDLSQLRSQLESHS